MMVVGQFGLLAAFVLICYAAFALLLGAGRSHDKLRRTGWISAILGVLALTLVMAVLAWALVTKDFRFQYVSQYSSRLLPWHFALSALWVGQAGSLLLWTWMLGIVALIFRYRLRHQSQLLRETAFGLLIAYCGFLTAMMVFTADPMEANIAPGHEGAGLSPLLQHPAMLIHPPIVFLGYATWAVPCALALAALRTCGWQNADADSHGLASSYRTTSDDGFSPAILSSASLSSAWVRLARPWSLLAWTILGSGILIGAYWSYEELGWGGYWAWDPVENGSLVPWLFGTALIHGLMTWQSCGMLKKTSLSLAIATFCMCNFATFLTRSGIFSSLHAFSQSPIGWLFLGMMLVLGVGGGWFVVHHRHRLRSDRSIRSVWTREAFVIVSALTLLLLAGLTIVGTLSVALSEAIVGRRILVGPEFYNQAVIPIGLVLLATMSAAPLLRWGSPPSPSERRALMTSAIIAIGSTLVAWIFGVRHLLGLAIVWLAMCSLASHVAPALIDAWHRNPRRPWRALPSSLMARRRLYGSFVIHLGFVCVVIGIAGSSLGSRSHDVVMRPGDQIRWAGRTIRFAGLIERQQPDKFIVEADLEITSDGRPSDQLRPAQHLHRLQNQWTTEVAILSSWSADFYTILHHGEGGQAVRMTFIENPLIRCMWFGGWIIVAGTGIRLWPSRRRVVEPGAVPKPHLQDAHLQDNSQRKKRTRRLTPAQA